MKNPRITSETAWRLQAGRALKACSTKTAIVAHECTLVHPLWHKLKSASDVMRALCSRSVMLCNKTRAETVAGARLGLPFRSFPILYDLARGIETSCPTCVLDCSHINAAMWCYCLRAPAETGAQSESCFSSAARPQRVQHFVARLQHCSPRSNVHRNLNPCMPCKLHRSAEHLDH